MSNYERVKNLLVKYFSDRGIHIDLEKDLHVVSLNEQGDKYLFEGDKNLKVISMDDVARNGYRLVKHAEGKPVNTVDAFLADVNNEWFFIEFKDCKLSSKKDNIEKNGMANFLMLQDVFEEMGTECSDVFSAENAMKFAREHIIYILVCSREKDPYTYEQVRFHDATKERYTPVCLQKFKDYFFKDAYAYTEEYFEKRFVNKFAYD